MTDHGVEGCEIVVPKFAWSETHQLPIATYGWAYSQKLKAITGKVNGWKFRGFPAGQVLFHGARGSASSKDPSLIEITYLLRAERRRQAADHGRHHRNRQARLGVPVGASHRAEGRATAKRLVRRPEAVYVEKVYWPANFAILAIGS